MAEFEGFPEDEIIRGCLKKDRKSQELLYKTFARKMYSICLSYASDRYEAQDILQDSFVKVFEKIKDYSGAGSIEGWIRRIVTNTAIDHYRQTTRAHKFIEQEKEKQTVEMTDNIMDKINFGHILETINKLPKGARVIFNLYVLEGYTHEEIADKLNISIGTSKSQVNRAKSLLQTYLKDMV
jgi:RNA polymerase sigma factor (sigma-70 family)